MRRVAVIGCGITKFGRDPRSVVDILAEASLAALEDSNTSNQEIDLVYVGNMASGEFEGRSGIGNALVSELALEPAFASKIENTSGSGGAAIHAGWMAVASGQCDLVLVAGGEKMTSVNTEATTDIIASLTHPEEYKQGATLLSFAGLQARYYLHKYGAPRESLAKVAVKNHYHATMNPKAHFQKIISVDDVLRSPIVADPLRLYDFCPISDGAAAVILCPEEGARKYVEDPVVMTGIGGATDTHVVHEREDPTLMKAVKTAAQHAYEMSHRGPKDIDVAELHDMSTVLEIVQSEDLGFFEKGSGWKAVEEDTTTIGGNLPINTSGGLKAKGHPIGATGVAQVIEVVNQLRGRCDKRQVDASVGLTCNVAGFGNNAVITVLERP